MSKMYEMIMDLPLFKGVGKDHVSSFLEKTHINFLNFNPGEKIVSAGEELQMIKFIISGEVATIHNLRGFDVSIIEKGVASKVLGADRLYGMSTGYSSDVVAVTKVSVFELSKSQYVKLLKSDNIYLLNFLNFLSLRAQRPMDAVMNYSVGSIGSRLKLLLSLTTATDATEVKINGSLDEVSRLISSDVESISHWLNSEETSGMVRLCDTGILIPSRNEFINSHS